MNHKSSDFLPPSCFLASFYKFCLWHLQLHNALFWFSRNFFLPTRILATKQDINCCQTITARPRFKPRISVFEFDRSTIKLTRHLRQNFFCSSMQSILSANGKLRRLNQLRPRFHLESDLNCLLINLFYPNFSSGSKSL